MVSAQATAITGAGPIGPRTAAVRPETFQPHPIHATERIWSETNCYVDLWVELLHVLGADPRPAMASVLDAGFDGSQWSFVKPQSEDLRNLHGIHVNEMNVWKPFHEHLIDNLTSGSLSTVEVDSHWLPDTAGTTYRAEHGKTTIVPLLIDPTERTMVYLHNAGCYELSGADFDGSLGIGAHAPLLPPYIEQVAVDIDRLDAGAAAEDRDIHTIREHFARRPADNPVVDLGRRVVADIEWVQSAGPEAFHLWSFGTFRQLGASAEIAADVARYLVERGIGDAAAAVEPFITVATAAKSGQFRMARAARGRAVDLTESVDAMTDGWAAAVDALDAAL